MAVDAERLARRIGRATTPAGWTKHRGGAGTLDRAPCARAAAKPSIDYPPELPVPQRADDIAAAIRAHPVVIVCGETGSGKTTQLPKICLAAGRGERGLIGHTRSRDVSRARAVAARIAQELGTTVGEARRLQGALHRSDAAGRVHQADDRRHPARRDAARSRRSLAYDTIIVDEAHERSLSIDFLLGYLKTLLARRADLKLDHHVGDARRRALRAHFGSAERPRR